MKKELRIQGLLYLSEEDVMTLGLTMKDVIGIIEESYRVAVKGEAKIMKRGESIDMSAAFEKTGILCSASAMAAYYGPAKLGGMKLGGSCSENEKRGLPFYVPIYVIFDPQSSAGCAPTAILRANWITSIRTACPTAIAAKHFARDKDNIVCIIGAGHQARFQLRGLSEVLSVREVRVVDIRRESRLRFAEQMSKELELTVRPAENVKDGIKNADIVIGASTTTEPVVRADFFSASFTCSISTRNVQHLEDQLILSMNKIIVDSSKERHYAKHGELKKLFSEGKLCEEDIYAELGEIVTGKKKGRETEDERVLVSNVGSPIYDIALASRVYKLAKEKNIGQILA